MLLVNQVRQIQGDAVFPAQVGSQAHILGRQGRGKTRLKVAPEQIAGKLFGDALVAAGTVGNHIGQHRQIHAGLDAQSEGFRHQNADAHAEHIVANLADHPVADGAAIDHMAADGVQGGLHPIKDGFIAADHYRQGSGGRAIDAAADRGVQHRDALGGANFVDAPNHRGRVGGQVHIDRPGSRALQNALFAQHYRFHIPGDGQGSEGNILAGDAFRRGVGPFRAQFQQVGGGFPPQVVDGQLMAGLNQVGRHRIAHIAQADKSHFHS